jgi:nucleotide-binding universal stress UspA family protein
MSYEIQTILFATDLGPGSGEVYRHAAGIARRFGARVHVLTVMSSATEPSMVSLDNYLPDEAIPKLREGAIQRIRASIDDLLAEAAIREGEGAVGSIQILEGKAADTVLAEAGRLGADMIVLGSHGHTALGEMLIGSVAHRVSARASVPVLLVPINQ